MSRMPDAGPQPETYTACFAVHAPAEPSVMPRVLDVFTRRGLVPSVWYSTLCGPDKQELQIDVQVADLRPEAAQRLAQCLRQLVCVSCVLTSEKRYALTA